MRKKLYQEFEKVRGHLALCRREAGIALCRREAGIALCRREELKDDLCLTFVCFQLVLEKRAAENVPAAGAFFYFF